MGDVKITSKSELHIYFEAENGTAKQILKNPKPNSETIITHATALNESLAGSLFGKWYLSNNTNISSETAITKISKIDTYYETKSVEQHTVFEVNS